MRGVVLLLCTLSACSLRPLNLEGRPCPCPSFLQCSPITSTCVAADIDFSTISSIQHGDMPGSLPSGDMALAEGDWLSGFRFSAGTLSPTYDSTVTQYTLLIPVETVSVTVTGTLGASDLVFLVNGTQLASNVASAPIDVHAGTTTVTLSVSSPMRQATYTIDVIHDHYLKPPVANLQQFGSAVALDGETMVVGAQSESSDATGVNGNPNDSSSMYSGAAYVFVKSGSTWVQQAYLKASNTQPQAKFGGSVAISGDTIVVGADGEASDATGVNGNQSDRSVPVAGAAYVFVRSGTTWTQQAYLKASYVDKTDPGGFGNSVAIDADTIVVGSSGESSNATGINGSANNHNSEGSGAAFVFVRSGTTWTQQAYLKASNTRESAQFGDSVAISSDTIVVGSQFESSNATGINGNQSNTSAPIAGAAYVFVRSGTTWTQQAYVKSSHSTNGEFGSSVAIDTDTIVVGAEYESSDATGVNGNQNDTSADSAGAAYVFSRTGATWTQQAYLKASNTESLYQFGISAAINGNDIVIGSNFEESASTGVDGDGTMNTNYEFSGAAYLFSRSGTTWTQTAFVKSSNNVATDADEFGYSVALSADTLAVGALGEDSSATGVDGNQADRMTINAIGAVYAYPLQ